MTRDTRWFEAALVFVSLLVAGAADGKPSTEATLPGGTRVRVLDIGASDALYSDRFKYIGKLGNRREERAL